MADKTGKLAKVGNAEHELGRTIVTMLLKEPFYGHLLGGIVRRVGEDVSTAAVALTPKGPELVVNPQFFLKELSAQQRVAVIKHEALHLVFRHLYRPLIRNGDAQLFNLAADLVVNQLIAPWPLPDSAVTLSQFPDLGLSADQTLEWYYEKLIGLRREMEQADKTPADKGASGNSPSLSAPRSAEALERIRDQTRHSDHSLWSAYGGSGFEEGGSGEPAPMLSDTLRHALESALEGQLIRARERTGIAKWGAMPASLREAIAQMEAKRNPKIDWRRALRIFASNGYRTRVVPTNRRVSKRFGTFPGVRIRREQRLAVVIDTSGSIGQEQLVPFFGEIHAIWRTGAEVVVLECDADVQRVYEYRGVAPESVQGRGGTAFTPAFEWLREPRNGRFDACVYLTDGQGPEPLVRPRCALMWVVSDEAGKGPHLKWGQVVVLGNG